MDELDKICVILTSMKKESAGTWATNENKCAYYDDIDRWHISWWNFEHEIKKEFCNPNEQQKATDKSGQ